jgi:peptidoglycan/xylan/chitin deacetylase (PgdA/CDA1 family)
MVGRVRSKIEPSALVLLYHRVENLHTDPQRLAVTPAHFKEHLEVLKEFGEIVSIADLVKELRQGTLRTRCISITFDDGYADNLLKAKPILEKSEAPATVFIVTGMIESRREFWWDAIERVFLGSEELPESLVLKTRGGNREWKITPHTAGKALSRGSVINWSVLSRENPTARHRIYREVCAVLRQSSFEMRQDILGQLYAWAKVEEEARDSHRTLTSAEIRELGHGGLIEVGAHTVTHTVLSTLDPDAQLVEMRESRRRLEELIGREVRSFAYPYGAQNDYSPASMQAAQRVGFDSACVNTEGLVFRNVHPYRIPRILVRDMDGEALSRRLSSYW